MLTLEDLPDNAPDRPQRILVRVDFNVPQNLGQISDDTRLKVILPTLTTLRRRHASIILLSHLGRPQKEANNPGFSLKPVADYLKEAFGLPISFYPACVGEEVVTATLKVPKGEILLLENLRFHAEEEENDLAFAQSLSENGDIYVNDAFSVSHRAHASIVGIPKFLPSYAGAHFAQEIKALESICLSPKKPVLAIVGGAKISTKLPLLESLLEKVDSLAIVGAMAHTFLAALGRPIGSSLVEKSLIPQALAFLERSKKLSCHVLLPVDGIIERGNAVSIEKIQPDQRILDAGPQTLALLKTALSSAKTLLWNGPLGLFEVPPFDEATHALARLVAGATAENNLISIAGGGDTAAALHQVGCFDQLTYVSTAGGAFLEWLEGKSLPGIEALLI